MKFVGNDDGSGRFLESKLVTSVRFFVAFDSNSGFVKGFQTCCRSTSTTITNNCSEWINSLSLFSAKPRINNR